MKHKKSRLTYANAASTLALALVIGGGTAYAAGLAPGSVGTEQLRKQAVTTPKVADDAVTSAKVRNGSLRLADLSDAQLPFTRVVTRSSTVSFFGEAAGTFKEKTTVCQDGEELVSGGYHVSALSTSMPISRPATADGGWPTEGEPASGWHVLARQGDSGSYATVTVYALCAS